MKGEIFDIMKSKPYLEQWLRVNRLFELVSLVELGKISDEQIYKYKFDLYLSFFVQCYHLRDWIVNSKVVKSHEIDEFIKSSYEFGLCRNLCLGVKHYHVTKPSTPQMADFSQDVGIKIPIVREYEPYSNTKERTRILADGKNHDALDLATRCINQWRQFLEQKNLL